MVQRDKKICSGRRGGGRDFRFYGLDAIGLRARRVGELGFRV